MGAVAVQVSSGVATIRVDRPPMNAAGHGHWAGLATPRPKHGRDDVRAVIIYGGGEGLRRRRRRQGDGGLGLPDVILRSPTRQDSFHRDRAHPRRPSRPSPATPWAGLELALCADLRIAGDNASQGLPEILLGIILAPAAPATAMRLIGPGGQGS